jgi:4-aminobutyrate aminotransferase-like enzyme
VHEPFDAWQPEIRVPPPGPRSRALAARLSRVECPDTTYLADDFPVFWARAAGANVWDADGNRYVDLTSAFGVAALGHGHPRIVAALQAQAAILVHGMGDVHPSELKVRVAEELAEVAPGDCGVALFGNAGFEAVEAALKTVALATGRPGCVAFEGAYHGVGHGALAATWRADFRAPFAAQLNPHVRFVPFPAPRRVAPGATDAAQVAAYALEQVDALLASPAGDACGAVLVEPVQGRAGIVVPHPSFLRGLREICTRRNRLLVADEILTGLGRTGRWFACEHSDVVPDLLCVGKSLAGGLPLSVCLGRPAVMAAWGRSTGEARHTSTFLGNPLACAAALAVLGEMRERDWPATVAARGAQFGAALRAMAIPAGAAEVRGMGWLWGVELLTSAGEPDARGAFRTVTAALRRGVLLLADGTHHNVLTCMPPGCLSATQQQAALGVLHEALVESAAARPARGERA